MCAPNEWGFKKTFIVGESLFNCIVPKPIQRAKPQVTPKVVKTQLKKTLSKNAFRNARKRAARALRKKEAKSQSIEAILSELSGTSSMVTASEKTASTLAVPTPKRTSATPICPNHDWINSGQLISYRFSLDDFHRRN
ncbi:unnamed protein product [Prunus armeniaca]|uniref:Uncharacterized protein n=1 Tax=Prunus armeniaca TaxID=36596 RepID=A0A6J5U749_PRUAR|nr:unnamed protein product [Prunus armeniaca]